jgi:hypothetical protein
MIIDFSRMNIKLKAGVLLLSRDDAAYENKSSIEESKLSSVNVPSLKINKFFIESPVNEAEDKLAFTELKLEKSIVISVSNPVIYSFSFCIEFTENNRLSLILLTSAVPV